MALRLAESSPTAPPLSRFDRCFVALALIFWVLCRDCFALQNAPGSASPEQLFQGAAAALQRGDTGGAARRYRELLSRQPGAVDVVEQAAKTYANAEAYLIAGQTRLGMSQFDLARRDADAAASLNPRLAGLQTLMGMVLEQTADYDGAEKALGRALLADANDYNAHFYLGAIFYFKRDMAKARLHLDRALQIQPASVQARYELALVERADGDVSGALKELESVVNQMPDWLQPHVELAAIYYRLHRPVDGAKQREIVDRMMAALQERQSQAARQGVMGP